MIWLFFGFIVLAVLIFTLTPLYKQSAPSVPVSAEVANYIAQIKDIDDQLSGGDEDEAALNAKKTDLQRHLLASSGQQMSPDVGPQTVMLSILIVGFGFGAMGLYAMLGNPELIKKKALKPVLTAQSALSINDEPQHENNASLPDLVTRLEGKLAQDGNNPEGWMLYARSLMTLGRFEDAFVAYNQVLILTGNNPNVAEEFEKARAFAQQQGVDITQAIPRAGPSADDVAAAAAMSEGDRAAMIQGMIEGLAAKLEDNPKNPDGWARLIRARKVLGQDDQAQKDIERMKTVFKDRPELAKEILIAAGWPVQ